MSKYVEPSNKATMAASTAAMAGPRSGIMVSTPVIIPRINAPGSPIANQANVNMIPTMTINTKFPRRYPCHICLISI